MNADNLLTDIFQAFGEADNRIHPSNDKGFGLYDAAYKLGKQTVEGFCPVLCTKLK